MGRRAASAPPAPVRTDHATAQIEVDAQRPWLRLLRLDGHEASHVDLRDPRRIEFAYVRRLADAVDLVADAGDPLDVVHLGGGGFTLPRYVAATRPGSRSEVFEHDAALVALVRQELGLRRTRRMTVRAIDARVGLARRKDASADVVVLDAFTGPLVPEHLTTREFLDDVRRVLRPGGVFAGNAIDIAPLQFARAFSATVLDAFPRALLVADRRVLKGTGDGGNVVVIASEARLPVARLRARAAGAADPEHLLAGAALLAFAGTAPILRDGVPFRHRLAGLADLWG